MKFYDLSGGVCQDPQITPAYQNGRAIGPMRISPEYIFFRSGRKTYVIQSSDLDRIYRRVLLVPARMCCGRGDLAVENIVLEKDGKTIAQITMPGERAGKAALEELMKAAPHAQFGCPSRQEA